MSSVLRALPFVAVLLLCVGCDQAVKAAATSLLTGAEPVSLAGGAVQIELAYNPGAFLSLGGSWPPLLRSLLLQWLVPLGLVVLCVVALRSRSLTRLQLVALGLLAGGGIGNSIDRIFQGGYVTDYVSIGVGALRTGVFNVADVAVMAGVLVFALASRDEARDAPAPDPAAAP
ncbi:MAG: signal peptidase II [Proteobacteria bacterium]|nr:MAG: signal peptidase II [Pseudomonadota bacterium]